MQKELYEGMNQFDRIEYSLDEKKVDDGFDFQHLRHWVILVCMIAALTFIQIDAISDAKLAIKYGVTIYLVLYVIELIGTIIFQHKLSKQYIKRLNIKAK